MKITRPTLILIALFWCSSLLAQNISRHGFGIYQSYLDYNARLLDGSVFAFDSSLSHSFRIAYQYRISPVWQFHAGIANGFSLNQPVKDRFLPKAYTLSTDVGIMYRFDNGFWFKENAGIAPFLCFAYRMDYVPRLTDFSENPWLAYNQYGLGLNFKLGDFSQIQLYTGFDQKLGADFNTLMHYRIGFNQNFGKRSNVPAIKDAPDIIVDHKRLSEVRDSMSLIIQNQGTKMDSLQTEIAEKHQHLTVLNDQVSMLEDSLKNCSGLVIRDTIGVTKPSTVAIPDTDKPLDLHFDSIGTRYYVIAFSTKKKKEAFDLKESLEEEFENVTVFEKDNGYFRVGVYGGNNLEDAQEIMKEVMKLGFAPVWISIE